MKINASVRMLCAAILLGVVAKISAEGLPGFSADVNFKQLQSAAAAMPAVAGEPLIQRANGGNSAYRPNVNLSDGWRDELPNCGGSVEMKIAHDNVYLIFRQVANCSNFDILSNNGDQLTYPNQKLQGTNPNRYGSFTIPKRFFDTYYYGYKVNHMLVEVRSNSRKTRDIIRINFVAGSW